MKNIISACGDICSECPRYVATKNNDIEALEKIAELWFRLGFRDKILPPSELQCNGCTKDKECSHNILSCEKIKTINNCGECNDFPCDKIEIVFKKSDLQKERCRQLCSNNEFEQLQKAFLMKREVLTEISGNRK